MRAPECDEGNGLSEGEALIREALELRSEGNRLYQHGEYAEAVDCWFRSLKESLRASCCISTPELWENQILCRLNISMAFLKLENWVDAKLQAELVIEKQPKNVKALLRLARSYEGLQEWSECHKILNQILRILREPQENGNTSEIQDSDDPEKQGGVIMGGLAKEDVVQLILEMRNRIATEKEKYKECRAKMLRYIGNRLSESPEAKTDVKYSTKQLTPFNMSDSCEKKITKDEFLSCSPSQLVQWTYKRKNIEDIVGDFPIEAFGETQEESPLWLTAQKIFTDNSLTYASNFDNPEDPLWTEKHSPYTSDFNRCLSLSLPLSVVYIFFKALTGDTISPGDEDKKFSEQDWECCRPEAQFKRKSVETLYFRKRLTLLVLGATSSMDLKSHWTALLRRLPTLTELCVIYIGFCDPNDAFNSALREGVMTPPMTFTRLLAYGKRITCYLFKGLFQLFLETYPDVLNQETHEFHPDFFCIFEPRLSYYFKTWNPVFGKLLETNIPILMTNSYQLGSGYPRETHLLHYLNELKARWIVPLQKNPYKLNRDQSSLTEENFRCKNDKNKFTDIDYISTHAVLGCVMGSGCSCLREVVAQIDSCYNPRCQLSCLEESDCD